jgi:RimJ/RimL family protein N-acetyltransferase
MTQTGTRLIWPSCSIRRNGVDTISRLTTPTVASPASSRSTRRPDAEVGLGLRPALTGMGLGQAFMDAGLRFAEDTLGATSFVLAVAAFNRGAIAVYERAGFQQVERYEHATNGGVHQFIRMRRPGSPDDGHGSY